MEEGGGEGNFTAKDAKGRGREEINPQISRIGTD